MDYREVVSAASIRCNNRRSVRLARGVALAKLLDGGNVDPRIIEPLGRQFERARLMNRNDLVQRLGEDQSASRKLFEAIIDRDDTLPRRFLTLGEIAARAVGRIVVRFGSSPGRYGSGALVGRQLAITNNHVLDSQTVAANAEIQLGYFEGSGTLSSDVRSFRFRPDDFFYTSEELDFTLVGVQSEQAGASTSNYGYVQLLPSTGKALIGESVNIVQHAGGKPQTISVRANTVVDVFDQWIHYTSDTAPGSSGAPVFNDEWQLVGLHHAAVPRQSSSEDGSIINEGVRISAIWNHLVQVFGGR